MKAGGRAGDSSAGYSGYDAHTSGLLGYRPGTVSSSGNTIGTTLRHTLECLHKHIHIRSLWLNELRKIFNCNFLTYVVMIV